MHITPFYAALFGLILVGLSVRTLRLRRKLRVAIGDGGQPLLMRAMRVHSNFVEYVPISLILIYFLEIETSAYWWIHCLCAALLIGRSVHAYGVSQVDEDYRFRVAGMVLTLGVIIAASLRLIVTYI